MLKSTVSKLEVKDIDEGTFAFQNITNFNQDFRQISDFVPCGLKYGIKYPSNSGLDMLQENINAKVLNSFCCGKQKSIEKNRRTRYL
jgi:hypothetical protein